MSQTAVAKANEQLESNRNMAQSAAAKVFAIPELLEQILLVYAAQTKHKQISGEDDSPIAALFVWQRIHRLAKSVITGSISLRRYMWLQRLADDCEGAQAMYDKTEDDAFMDPFYRLLRQSKEGHPKPPRVTDVHLNDDPFVKALCFNMVFNELQQDEVRGSFLGERMHSSRAESSWRSILVMRIAKRPTRTIITRDFCLRGVGEYEKDFEVTSETTLGELCDWLDQSEMDSFESHCSVLKQMIIHGRMKPEGRDDHFWEADLPRPRRTRLYG